MSGKRAKRERKAARAKCVSDVQVVRCYIEEYVGVLGLCARLRDKVTNRRVVILPDCKDSCAKDGFLRFLSEAKARQSDMPTIFDMDGDDLVLVKGCIVSDTADVLEVDASLGGYEFGKQVDNAVVGGVVDDRFSRTTHPRTGDVMWRINVSGMDAVAVCEKFIAEYQRDGYSLSIFNTLTNWSGAEITCSISEMGGILAHIYCEEHAEPIQWIGLNSLSDSYVVGMPLCMGRVSGHYKVEDGKLKFVSKLLLSD